MLADRGDHNNTVGNFLQRTAYKFNDDFISEIQVALVDSNHIIYACNKIFQIQKLILSLIVMRKFLFYNCIMVVNEGTHYKKMINLP